VYLSYSLIASGASDGLIRLFDGRSMSLSASVKAHEYHIKNLVKADTMLVSCAKDSLIKMWDIRNLSECVRSLQGHEGAVYDMAIDGSRLISVALDGQLRLWDFHSL